MATDAGLNAGLDAGSSWSLLDQGSFVLGRCEACGFTSPARRARYSAESDMRAHEVLCGAVASSAQPPDGAEVRPERLRRAGSASRHRAARSG